MPPAPKPHKRNTGTAHTARPAKHKPRNHEGRDNSSARGYDHKWTAFRAAFLLSNPLCEYCLADGIVKPATVCDHDLPHQGDKELFWNNTYTALCAKHHNSDKQRAELRYSGDDLLQWIRKRKGKL